MIVSSKEQHEIWKQAYIAAIGGLSAKIVAEEEIANRAVAIANRALSAYTHEMSKKSF